MSEKSTLNILWDQSLELASKSLEESKDELSVVLDRFTWDTGSDEDRALIASLEQSISIKKGIVRYCAEYKVDK